MNKYVMIGLACLVSLALVTPSFGVTNVVNAESNSVSNVSNTVTQTAGWGKEIGTMLREAGVAFVETTDGTLNVTTEHLYKFADSKVGKYAMIFIGWKLFGKDGMDVLERLVGYLVGSLMIIFLTKGLWALVRRYTVGSLVVTKKEGWWIFSKKTLEFKPSAIEDDEMKGGILFGAGFCQVLIIIAACMIMFG